MNPFKKKPDTYDRTVVRVCLTCSHTFTGRYCSNCGEKVILDEDRSFKHYLSDLINAFTFVDGKFFNSLKSIVLSPGRMASNVARGIRQPYMKPIAFFFVGNFIYFLFPIFNTFNTPLVGQMNYMLYGDMAREMVQNHLAHTGQTFEEFEPVYNAATTGWSKLLLIFLIIYIFPLAAVINYSKRVYLLDQLTFSVEMITFVLFVPTIMLGLVLALLAKTLSLFQIDTTLFTTDVSAVPIVVVLLMYFLVRGIREFYQFPWWRVAINAMLLLGATYVLIPLYRLTLFLATMAELG